MNEKYKSGDDEIRDLLVAAGPPPELPDDDLAAIRKAARREWRRTSGTPIFEGRFTRPLLAAAAGLVLVVTAVWLYLGDRPPTAAEAVATVELLQGEAGALPPLAVGDELAAGAELATADGGEPPARLALRMAGGHSVRLDSGSRVRVASALRLELERGAVYVDSGPGGAAPGLEVVTRLGTVREIGTQFEVRVDGGVRVRVREGRVALSRDGRSVSASRGEQLLVDAGGAIDRSQVAVAGPAWIWVQQAAPAFEVEGRSLAAYLAWISRETGLEIRYEDPRLEASTAEIVYGSIEGLTPETSLAAVLPGSHLGYRLDEGALVITRASE